MTVLPGSLRTVLGPMRCRECGRLVVWGIAVQVFGDAISEDIVRRRGMYDVSTEHPHRCAMPMSVAT